MTVPTVAGELAVRLSGTDPSAAVAPLVSASRGCATTVLMAKATGVATPGTASPVLFAASVPALVVASASAATSDGRPRGGVGSPAVAEVPAVIICAM